MLSDSLPAFRKRHLGETLGLGKEPEFLGDWKGIAEDVGDLLGLHKSPLWSFHSSSSFSMESRLLTFDSFSNDSCRTACSVESCLKDKRTRNHVDLSFKKITWKKFPYHLKFDSPEKWPLWHKREPCTELLAKGIWLAEKPWMCELKKKLHFGGNYTGWVMLPQVFCRSYDCLMFGAISSLVSWRSFSESILSINKPGVPGGRKAGLLRSQYLVQAPVVKAWSTTIKFSRWKPVPL